VASQPEQQSGPAARFELIRQQFVAGLVRRAQEIDEAPDAESLRAALHRLAGVAGSYGYDHLGSLARTAMQTSESNLSTQVAEDLAQLKAEFKRIAS